MHFSGQRKACCQCLTGPFVEVLFSTSEKKTRKKKIERKLFTGPLPLAEQ